MVTLEGLNKQDEAEFIETLGDVFEHSPWVAKKAATARPFATVTNLFNYMVEVVNNLPYEEKLQLIREHPNLGDKMEMSVESIKEQQGAGLTDLTPEEYENFLSLNKQYMEKFHFPFILAVRGKDKNDIYQAMKMRIHHSAETEFETAISEIYRIAQFRIQDKLDLML